jgi:hypothetical protein
VKRHHRLNQLLAYELLVLIGVIILKYDELSLSLLVIIPSSCVFNIMVLVWLDSVDGSGESGQPGYD